MSESVSDEVHVAGCLNIFLTGQRYYKGGKKKSHDNSKGPHRILHRLFTHASQPDTHKITRREFTMNNKYSAVVGNESGTSLFSYISTRGILCCLFITESLGVN